MALDGPERPSSMPSRDDERQRGRRRHLVGLALVLLVVVLWVTSSFLMNAMFTSMTYNKPFLITYLCTSTFSLYLVRPAISYARIRYTRRRSSVVRRPSLAPVKSVSRLPAGFEPIGTFTDANGMVYVRPEFSYRTRSQSRSMSRGRPASIRSQAKSVIVADPPLTVRETASLALMFCALWFCANWSMNASLGYTTVSSTTILSSMSGLFTLAVGSCVGVETLSLTKLASVVLSVSGVVLISRTDASMDNGGSSQGSREPTAPLLGDSLALLSALAYALYVVLLKVRVRTEARVSMTLFFGFVGLFNIALIWPLGFVLHWTGIETWQWPRGRDLWLNIAVNAMITFVSDAIYVRAMLMTSPLAVTLGISLTIPLALVGDVVRGNATNWKTAVGGALVLGSFVANGLVDMHYAAATETDPPKLVDFGAFDDDGGERAHESERLLRTDEEEGLQ